MSVTVLNYNYGGYLPACLDSILAQTFGDFELLVLDNASTDDTVALIEAAADERITIERSPDNLGYAAEENPVSIHDFHATMLHLLGVDHKRLTVKFQGRDFRLTDVHGNVVKQILA